MRGNFNSIVPLPSYLRKLAPHPASVGASAAFPHGGRLSPKGFPLGGSCRPQAADEGQPCLYRPFTELPPETRPSSGLRPPSPAGGRLSPKGFPLGGSCRPQAADEGRCYLYCPFTELLREHRPSSGLGRGLGHLPPRGRRHPVYFSFSSTILNCARSLGDTPGIRPAWAKVRGRIFASFSRDSNVIVSMGA